MKFNQEISLGNVIAIALIVIGGAGTFARMESNDVRQEERMVAVAARVSNLERAAAEGVRRRDETLRQLQANLDEMNRRLATIEGYLRPRSTVPP